MAKSTVAVRFTGDVANLQQSIGQVDGKMAKLGTAAAGVGVALGAAFVGAGVGLAKIGGDFDAQFDKIRVGTGATGAALEGLQDDFKQVLKDVPASFDDAGSAIADLNTRLGLTGKPLQDLSAQFLDLSRITETDLATNVDNITRVFGDWGVAVEDQATSMDQLYRAAQASGIGIDDLSTSVVQFGAPLRNLGFGFEDSLALLAQFNKTGVNTETVFAGLKAGVGKLAKEGEDVPTTFRRIVDEITALGPGSEATGKAIELFGQRAGPDLADAIAGGKFELDGMLSAITDGEDTISKAADDTEDFGEKWTLLKNRILVGLEPLATKVFDSIGEAMDRLGPVIDELMGGVRAFQAAFRIFDGDVTSSGFAGFMEKAGFKVRQAFEVIKSIVESVRGSFQSAESGINDSSSKIGQIVDRLKGMFQSYFDAISAIVTWAVDFISAIWEGFGSNLIRYAEETFDNILKFIGGAFEALQGIFEVFAGIFTGDWSRVWDGVKMIFSGVWNALQGVVRQAMNLIRLAFEAAWATLKTVITAAWGVVGDIVRNAWGNALDGVKIGVTRIISFVSGIDRMIKNAIGNLGSLLYNAGREVIQGLIDGIMSKVDAIGDAMGSVGRTIGRFVPGSPVKEGPLRVLNNGGAGKKIAEMLAGGIRSGSPVLRGAMGDMTAAAIPAGVAPVRVSGAGVTVNVNISGSVYGDRRALMGEISQAVRDGIPLPR